MQFGLLIYVNCPNFFYVLLKIFRKNIWEFRKCSYLCIRFRSIFGCWHMKKEFFEILP